ncbi:MAG: hypothetical protein H7331_10630, partial [Bacteroidia bacterium]|nr:hypothetical protein [Bacteroidia bacterium]
MTLKEAIIKSLEDIGKPAKAGDVFNQILARKYYDFGTGKTPSSAVASSLGDFMRKGDARVKRIKQNDKLYTYYLTKNELAIGEEVLSGIT